MKGSGTRRKKKHLSTSREGPQESSRNVQARELHDCKAFLACFPALQQPPLPQDVVWSQVFRIWSVVENAECLTSINQETCIYHTHQPISRYLIPPKKTLYQNQAISPSTNTMFDLDVRDALVAEDICLGELEGGGEVYYVTVAIAKSLLGLFLCVVLMRWWVGCYYSLRRRIDECGSRREVEAQGLTGQDFFSESPMDIL